MTARDLYLEAGVRVCNRCGAKAQPVEVAALDRWTAIGRYAGTCEHLPGDGIFVFETSGGRRCAATTGLGLRCAYHAKAGRLFCGVHIRAGDRRARHRDDVERR